jgi:hypothetical protein
MKGCFEDRTLELLQGSEEVDELYKSGAMSPEEYVGSIDDLGRRN